MASIYCLLRAESPEKAERARSPFLSRSSTSVILPRRGNGEENSASNSKSTVEVCSISVEKNQMPDVSCAITHYRLLVEQLERVDLSMSGTSIKLAFWINVYNSLVMHVSARICTAVLLFINLLILMILLVSSQPTCVHLQAYLAYGIPNSSLKRMAVFHKVKKMF